VGGEGRVTTTQKLWSKPKTSPELNSQSHRLEISLRKKHPEKEKKKPNKTKKKNKPPKNKSRKK